MEHAITSFVAQIAAVHGVLLLVLIAILLLVLGKGADLLVDESVLLARRSGIPTVIIGATVVSIGTTMPEAAISVFAALQGEPGLALGNAVGSIICDTGLILGLACVIGELPLDRAVVNRQGWIQLGAGVLLVAISFLGGSHLPRWAGFLFLSLLVVYLWLSIRWAKRGERLPQSDGSAKESMVMTGLKIAAAIGIVIASSRVLIPAIELAAQMAGIPEDIIAATLVAFGTSLPELVTAMTAVRKGHGELAVGNVIGADILNVLFVAGAACAVTPGGLAVPDTFRVLHFPALLTILVAFRIGIFVSGKKLRRPFGYFLLASYLAYLILQYALFGGVGT
ncbi:MAG: sodium:calcium antiporter [Elusimicrobiota bacterium]